jgi:DNA-binding SARP family transcriptional activator
VTDLCIELLGGPRITRAGRPVALHPGKGLALLAWLAAEHGVAHRRDLLCELLWPELPLAAARHNLRQRLTELRAALETGDEPLFHATRDTVQLHPAAPLRCDLDAFLTEGEPADLAHAAARLGQYKGPFLAALPCAELGDFHAWVLARREALHQRAAALLEALVTGHASRGERDAALAWARRLVEHDPWNETGHRAVMRLLADGGERGAALRHYESFRASLAQELGALPDPATRELHRSLRDAPAPREGVAERRRLTVVHVALALPEGDDPEEAAARLQGPQQRIEALLSAAGGYCVPWHLGGVVACFGYPDAREGAARAAATAALRVATEHGNEVRVGLHNGAVITAAGHPDPHGFTLTTARRAARAAAPGTLCATAAIAPLLHGFFHLEATGEMEDGGDLRRTALYRVGPATGAHDRLDAGASRLTALVGREAELHALRRAWERARTGALVALAIEGEAGIGKSRLVREFIQRLRAQDPGLQHLELRGLADGGAAPLQPLARLVARLAGIGGADPPQVRDAALTRFAPPAGRAALASLLDLPAAEPARPGSTASQRKAHTIEALIGLWRSLAAAAPLLLVVEDFHWLDPSSVEVIERLVNTGTDLPLLLLLTARPGLCPSWPTLERLELAPLAPLDCERMIAGLADGQRISRDRRLLIARMTDGIPLFVEEMTAATVADNDGVPATLDELLAARLARLGPARALAQTAALFGREFDAAELAAASNGAVSIAPLLESGLVVPLGGGRFQFRHALLQEAAYRTLTREERQAGHRRIVALLRARGAAWAAAHPHLLAHHLTGAGETDAAVRAWLEAGRQAVTQWANLEAIARLRQGLALLPQLSADGARDHLELDLLVALGKPLIQTQGFGAPEAGEVYRRALALVERLGREEERFAVTWGWWLGSADRDGHPRSRDLAYELVAIAERSDDPWLAVSAYSGLGNTCFWLGEFDAAQAALERALALAEPLAPRAWDDSGEDPAVVARAFLSWTLWLLGDAERALTVGHEAVTRARALDHPNSLGYAYAFLALTCRLRGEPHTARRWADEALALGTTYNMQIWTVCGMAVRGWALAQLGDGSEVEAIAAAVAAVGEAQPSVVSVFYGLLAEAQIALGDYAEGLASAEAGLAAALAKDDHWFEAGFHALRAVALRTLGWASEADDAATRATAVAARQHAVGFDPGRALRAR